MLYYCDFLYTLFFPSQLLNFFILLKLQHTGHEKLNVITLKKKTLSHQNNLCKYTPINPTSSSYFGL